MIEEIKLEHGKYTFQHDTETGRLTCLRHGEAWRDFIGDKAVFALFSALHDKQYKMTHHSAVTLTVHALTVKENKKFNSIICLYDSLLNKVNRVTSDWRHRRAVDPSSMNALCHRQVTVEDAIRKLEREK